MVYWREKSRLNYHCRIDNGFFVNSKENILLCIEDAYENVQVFLDQKDLGYRMTPPYQFLMDVLSKGTHHLIIEVTNTLDKEIHDMFSLTEIQEPSGIIGKIIMKK